MELLSEEQIEQELEKLSNWKRLNEKWFAVVINSKIIC